METAFLELPNLLDTDAPKCNKPECSFLFYCRLRAARPSGEISEERYVFKKPH
jgi:hypothetical protein